jgi:hypothetical protein
MKKMSKYMTVYSVFEEAGLTLDVSLKEACEGIANWINDKFGDILTANVVTVNESYGTYRTEIYTKYSSKICCFVGHGLSSSLNDRYFCTGYVTNGNVLTNTTSTTANDAINFGYVRYNYEDKLSNLSNSPVSLKFVVIRGEHGVAADFTAPSFNSNKKVLYVGLDEGITVLVQYDKIYAEKNGAYYATDVTLPAQPGASEKVLSRFAIPKTGILPEHLYLSEDFVGSNNPYKLNGRVYADVLFCSGTVMGFALELGEG